MFLEILTQSANTKGVKSKSFRYWNQKVNSQATQNNHYKTSNLSVPFGYKLWKMVVKKTYKYRGKQKKGILSEHQEKQRQIARKN